MFPHINTIKVQAPVVSSKLNVLSLPLHCQVHFHLAANNIWAISCSYVLNRANICADSNLDLHGAESTNRIAEFDRPYNMEECEIRQNAVKLLVFSP